jgi:NAD(P)-dependent dehydrogenase (short-subunit alcohol dehydrogenase family)
MTFIERFSLVDRIAVVTGANRGLGLAAARALAEAGADVAMFARDAERLETAAREVGAAGGRRVFPLAVDVSRADAVAEAMREVVSSFGRPSVLVNNAGIEVAGMLTDLDPADWESVFAVNIGGTFACTQAFVQALDGQPGSIVNLASTAAVAGVTAESAYCASKGGVAAATRAFAVELARSGIRVNAIAPGYFATDMPTAIIADPELTKRLLSRVPLRRFGEPSEIGPLIVYLASEASSFMTGSVLFLDGGYTAQ